MHVIFSERAVGDSTLVVSAYEICDLSVKLMNILDKAQIRYTDLEGLLQHVSFSGNVVVMIKVKIDKTYREQPKIKIQMENHGKHQLTFTTLEGLETKSEPHSILVSNHMPD